MSSSRGAHRGFSTTTGCRRESTSLSTYRFARTDRVYHAFGKRVDHNVGIERLVIGAAAGQHPALAELQDERLAACAVIQRGGERPHAGILVAEGESRFPLVRRDQVKILEYGDVSPARSEERRVG